MIDLELAREMNLPSVSEASIELEVEVELLKAIQTASRGEVLGHFERFCQFPQNIFLLRHGGRDYWGRKFLSNKHKRGELKELHCSIIELPMILGENEGFRICEDGVKIYFCPSERLGSFSEIDNLADTITHPFVYLDPEKRKERCSPADGWRLTNERMDNLSSGEKHLREFTIDYLQKFNLNPNAVVYDPACSTGIFLERIKQSFPRVITIGQDLSRSMVDEASKRVDVVHCGCSSSPAVETESCDVVFFRFLNSEVVNRRFAESNLKEILKTLKLGGIAIVFGHTPVLLDNIYLTQLEGFSLVNNIGHLPDFSGIFQYHVLRKIN